MRAFFCVLLGVLLLSDLRIDWCRYQDVLRRGILLIIGIVEIVAIVTLILAPLG